jgi:predicted transposase/invertase (TIGR01784 family)
MQNLNKQSAETLCLPKRSRFYQALIDFGKLKEGKTYRYLKDTDIVFICTFDPFGHGAYRYTFDKTCDEIPALKLGDGTRAIFYNTTSAEPDIPEGVKELFEYINTGRAGSRLTRKMDEAVARACMNTDIVEAAMRSEMLLMDAENIGYDRGFAAGEIKGEAKGEKKGEKIGEKKGRINALVQMLSRGGTEDDLRKFHDATDEEIKQAKERMLTLT